jgi:hypothetical protein
MFRIMLIIILSGALFSGCQKQLQNGSDVIVIDKDSLKITDIHGESIRLTGAVKDSVLNMFKANNVLESVDTWIVIEKLDMPDQILPLPLPEGFEDDPTAYTKDYSEYGSHYYVIFVSKSRQEKERLLASLDEDYDEEGLRTVVITNWDLSISINEDKTKVLETWIYR